MPAVSFARFAEELLILYQPPRRARSTYRQMSQVLREFAVDSALKRTSDLRPVAIARWMDRHPERTAVTTRSLLRCFRAACSHAMASGYLSVSPFTAWKPADWIRADSGPPSRPHPGHCTGEQIRAVLERADLEAQTGQWESCRRRALIYLYSFTGMRAGEGLHLWTSDVDLSAEMITIQPHAEDGYRPKTLRSAARLPIARPLLPILATWLPLSGCRWLFPGLKRLGPWLTGGPGVRPLDQVAELGRRAGVAGLTIATFRKTFGTYAKTWQFSPLELQAWLRHTSVATQRWYDEEEVEALRPSAAKIQFPRIAISA